MPTTNNNQNPTTNQNDKAHDPPDKSSAVYIWQNLRFNRRIDDGFSTPPFPTITEDLKEEKTLEASPSNSVLPNSQINPTATETVRIKLF
jgi:hypothetical protein